MTSREYLSRLAFARTPDPWLPPVTAGEGPGTCRACGALLTPGTALRVRELRSGSEYAVCRPNLLTVCLRAAGRRSDATIELWDADAAAAFDHEARGRFSMTRDEYRTTHPKETR